MNPAGRRDPGERPPDGRGIPMSGRLSEFPLTSAQLSSVPGSLVQSSIVRAADYHGGARGVHGAGTVPGPGVQQRAGGGGGGGEGQYQRLRVDDALWYLDQVKAQFGDQPHVYNQFLDIMKEFKSQSIDTPGVITRVSMLFRGRPDLISGFNTFLPNGYKIEVQHAGDGNQSKQAFNVTLNISSSGGANGQPNRVSTYHIMSDRQGVATRPSIIPNPQQQQPPHEVLQPPIAHIPPQQPAPPQQQKHAVPKNLSLLTNNGIPPQPEFSKAMNYVNKIKNRFQNEPQVYKTFMDILHSLQKNQKSVKAGTGASVFENEVFSKVQVLFKDQPDLLKDFTQFLPEYQSVTAQIQLQDLKHFPAPTGNGPESETKPVVAPPPAPLPPPTTTTTAAAPTPAPAPPPPAVPPEPKMVIHSEQDFFDKVKKALKSQEVYDNFLRCIVLYNEETLSASDIVHIVVHFIGKFPELFAWFKNSVGYKDAVPTDQGRRNRVGELEINYASCKRYGASYRAHPANYVPPRCMGRTDLCKQVLNDTWRSYPCWSEDSTFSGSKKTQYEEYINKCDDERFELDVVIETNLTCIKQLEAIQKKMAKLPPDEAARFRLDNKLGGTSEVIGRQAIKRIYGDKFGGIVDGLKKSPQAVIPIVLKRLKSKDEEWCEARRQFGKIWSEQYKKYHLKSLDHQSASFKQTDVKSIRSKNLVTEIETLYDERMEQGGEKGGGAASSTPHLLYVHRDHHILEDARALIIHHLRRQSHLQKEEKTKVKVFLNSFLQDFFFAPRGDISEDESDEASSEEDDETRSRGSRASSVTAGKGGTRRSARKTDKPAKAIKLTPTDGDAVDAYNLFYTNNQWYAFLRQHQILCERLFTINTYNATVAEQEMKDRKCRKEPTAQAIKMRQTNPLPVEHYYTHFLSLVKDLLDCNIEQGAYEDKLREMFGVNSYVAFTLDKLITHIVRQSHTLVTDAGCNQLKNLYTKYRSGGGAGGSLATQPSRLPQEQSYLKDAEQAMVDENLYKIYFFKQGSKLTIELIDGESNEETETEEKGEEKEGGLEVNSSQL